jgi:hypothetical protein
MSCLVYLGVVIVDDTRRYYISSAREVNDSWRGSGTLAEARSATIALGDGSLDGCCVIREAVTLRAKVLDIAEDVVSGHIRVEGCKALMLDVLEPIRSAAARCAGRTGLHR